MLPEFVYITRFAVKAGGHGGNRRTRQMAELFAELGVRLANISPYAGGGEFNSDSVLFSPDRDFDSLYGFNGHIASQLSTDRSLAEAVASSAIKGAVVDDPVFFPYTMRVLAEKGIPVVSVIHNIEAFLPRSMEIKPQWDVLQEEVRTAMSSGLCVTIAREDAWLLRNMGVECYNFPYFPSADVEAQLAGIRISRRKSEKKFCLCMGTAFNPPTLFGMKRLVENWPGLTGGQLPLVLAGYGVERFFIQENMPASVIVAGGVDDEKLGSLLSECIACVLHQDVGAGALTKIPELLRAGIPVVASQHAARSYGGCAGVYEYQDLVELPQVLAQVMQKQSAPSPLVRADKKQLLCNVAEVLGIKSRHHSRQ
ncbi:hypothetical protein [Maridesulfovibrio sp.]|uniref:hypothetical protein n=1 Tax=Maridesulfovibrio sp. TaxID=2795000 RepID=UPI0029C9C5AB|nr:hypothetical protein [Maridesulfovibrio sp.]